jgi:hypothetical protein
MASSASASSAMLWFFILTTIYFIIKYYIKDGIQSKIYFGIYITLLIIGEYIINLSLTESMCGNKQWSNAMLVTLIPWVFIFGILNIVLSVFPGWLSPFSNTFGYAVVKIAGIGKFFDNILKSKVSTGTGSSAAMNEALEHIYSDKSLLINEITQQNFERFWSNMSGLFKTGVSANNEIKDQLLDYIRLKDNIAEYIWYMLTGGLVTSVGYNYIVNSGCNKSVKDMQKRHKEYEAQALKQFKEKQEAQPRVYASTE